jgi:hypothetical protein
MNMPQVARSRQGSWLGAVLAALALPGLAARADAAATDPRLPDWTAAASAGVAQDALDALTQMPDPARRLLALRGYLRAGSDLSERWSWTEAQMAAYPDSADGKVAAADLDAVQAEFARENPGFTLDVNRQPRSLEVQLEHWNSNPSVARAAAALMRYMAAKFPKRDPPPSSGAIRVVLKAWSPPSAATLAVPGLSAHGQGRAYDFRVMQGDRTVAGTEAASARTRWDKAGWTKKLAAAVAAAGVPFEGPLMVPYEPWHYAYAPKTGTATR